MAYGVLFFVLVKKKEKFVRASAETQSSSAVVISSYYLLPSPPKSFSWLPLLTGLPVGPRKMGLLPASQPGPY